MAERDAVRRHSGQSDQVGVIISVVFFDGRQTLARHEQIGVHQFLGGVAIGEATDDLVEAEEAEPDDDLEAEIAPAARQPPAGRATHRGRLEFCRSHVHPLTARPNATGFVAEV